jgi:S1-C subfamily serine protease
MTGPRGFWRDLFVVPTAAILLAIALVGAGCSRSKESAAPAKAAQAETSDSKPKTAREALDQQLNLANVYIKHKEFDKAEALLEKAIAAGGPADMRSAIKLLDQVKTQKNELSDEKPGSNDVGLVAKTQVVPEKTAIEEIDPPTAEQPQTADSPVSANSPTEVTETGNASAETDSTAETHDAEPIANNAVETEMPSDSAPAEPENAPAEADELASTPSDTDAPSSETDLDGPSGSQDPKVVTEQQIRKFEISAKKLKTAKEVLDWYNTFLSNPYLSDGQREKLQAKRAEWEDRAAKRLFRLGTEWVARDRVEKAENDADDLVAQARELLQVENYKEAGKLLKKASQIDQNGIRADFILGLLSSLWEFDEKTASQHFRRVLSRVENHVPALNNLALTQVKGRNWGEAHRHWKTAVEIAPDAAEVTHNIGRLIQEVGKNKIDLKPDLLQKFSTMYAKATASGKGRRTIEATGWLYMPLVLTADEQKREQQQSRPSKSGDRLLAFSTGSGVVIQQNYILTNRHVVDDDTFGPADQVMIVDPSDPDHAHELDAQIVAMAPDVDLAIVRCDTLNAPACPLGGAPQRSEDVIILGFPHTQQLGRDLKTTKGVVTALPDRSHFDMYLFDAEVNPGNSGGPVCSNRGSVFAIATHAYARVGWGNYSGGIPVDINHKFVSQHLQQLQSIETNARELGWKEVDNSVSKSTVMLVTYRRQFAMGLDQRKPAEDATSGSYLEDTTCSACNGLGNKRCPGLGCRRGHVYEREGYEVWVGTRDVRRKETRFHQVKKTCSVCLGRGFVDCPHCVHGNDPNTGKSSGRRKSR